MTGDNGMLQAFPPNTGVGWYTMATGAYPAEHGSTNNTYFRAGDAFSNRTSFSAAGMLQADTIANAAERAGKKVAQIDWVGGAAADIDGPTVDFTNFFSNRGVLVGAAERDRAGRLGVLRRHLPGRGGRAGAPAGRDVPVGDPAAPPKETTWTINSTFAAQNPNRTYNVYFYDSVVDGDVGLRPRRSSARSARPARAPSIDLAVGDFQPLKLTGANGLIGARAGQTVGHYIKLISLAPDASQFKLYDTSLARAIATCGAVCNGLPAGGCRRGPAREVHRRQPPAVGRGRLRAAKRRGVVDEDTYVEQGRDLERAYSLQVINYILGTLQPDTDLAMVGYPFTDEVSHQFLGLVSPDRRGRRSEPVLRRRPEVRRRRSAASAERRTGSRSARATSAAPTRTPTRSSASPAALMGGDPTTFAGSDHGFAPPATPSTRPRS